MDDKLAVQGKAVEAARQHCVQYFAWIRMMVYKRPDSERAPRLCNLLL
jgi:hypothetical protein